jgi:AraC-like DNA-binding protein
MTISRPPSPRLRPFVSLIWAAEPASAGGVEGRELVLPTGAMHLVVRIGGSPVRIFSGPNDATGRTIAPCVVGGARASAYRKQTGGEGASVGALLRPGAVQALFGAPAAELSNRHTALEDVWSKAAVAELGERIEEAPDAPARLSAFERFLESGLVDASSDTLAAYMQSRLELGVRISELVTDLGFSHRHLCASFTQASGLTPKLYQRLRRFNRALDRLQLAPERPLADLAADLGYADQAHLSRDFREFSSLSPAAFRRAAPVNARHVPIQA